MFGDKTARKWPTIVITRQDMKRSIFFAERRNACFDPKFFFFVDRDILSGKSIIASRTLVFRRNVHCGKLKDHGKPLEFSKPQ